MKRSIIIIALMFQLLLIVPAVLAEVVIFDQYETTMSYHDGKLQVIKQLRLKNTGDNPIIPGEIHFKISKESKKGTAAPDVQSFKVTNKYDKELDTRQVASDDEVDLVFTVWDPLLPDFYYDMTMTYEIDFKPKGILFYNVVLPEERTTIPIRQATTVFKLPKKYHVTYLSPDGKVSSEGDGNVVRWDQKEAYNVEYSIIPFPKLGFRAVNVFWVLIIILFLVNLFFRMRKKARLARS